MADRYDEDRWLSRGPSGWDDNRVDNGERAGGGRSYNRDRSERGPVSRGADEVRSWFGDEEAQRRRDMDEQRDAMRERYRGPRDNQDRGRGWSRDEARTSGIGQEWSPYDAQSGWEGGGRTSRHPSYDSYERDAANRLQVERNRYGSGADCDRADARNQGSGRGFTERGDRDAYDRFQGGYFDSSMGYADVNQGTGSLNPFAYRGPGSSASRASSYAPSGSFSGRGPKNYQRSDERLREDIVDRLTEDHRVDASDIDVTVTKGEVTLSGQVHDRRMRRAAEECIEEMPGVRDVHNNLQVAAQRGELGAPGAQQDRDDITSLHISPSQTDRKS